jgi:hypothetical protein
MGKRRNRNKKNKQQEAPLSTPSPSPSSNLYGSGGDYRYYDYEGYANYWYRDASDGEWKQKYDTKAELEVKYANHPRIYLGYGSNLNVVQMQERCPTAMPLCAGHLNDYALEFSGVCTAEPRPGERCPIAAWQLEPRDIAALDRYEGYPSNYGKRMAKMAIMGEQQDCFFYVLNRPYELETPFTFYYETVEEGYNDWGLDITFLEDALDRAWDQELIAAQGKSGAREAHAERAASELTTHPALLGSSEFEVSSDPEPDIDTFEDCVICGERLPIAFMFEVEEDGVGQGWICCECEPYMRHVPGMTIKDEFSDDPWYCGISHRKTWRDEGEDLLSSDLDADAPAPQDADFIDSELDYSGSYWKDSAVAY